MDNLGKMSVETLEEEVLETGASRKVVAVVDLFGEKKHAGVPLAVEEEGLETVLEDPRMPAGWRMEKRWVLCHVQECHVEMMV